MMAATDEHAALEQRRLREHPNLLRTCQPPKMAWKEFVSTSYVAMWYEGPPAAVLFLTA
jgi:hypothetical protein